ncbi:MAG: hypothetical protein WC340_16845 [Kiritimatiellia bacterium]
MTAHETYKELDAIRLSINDGFGFANREAMRQGYAAQAALDSKEWFYDWEQLGEEKIVSRIEKRIDRYGEEYADRLVLNFRRAAAQVEHRFPDKMDAISARNAEAQKLGRWDTDIIGEIEQGVSDSYFYTWDVIGAVAPEAVAEEETVEKAVSKEAMRARNIAKFFGGKALKGSKKQKEWGEKIRAEKLAEMDEALAEVVVTDTVAETAKFWIENREKDPEQFREKFSRHAELREAMYMAKVQGNVDEFYALRSELFAWT